MIPQRGEDRPLFRVLLLLRKYPPLTPSNGSLPLYCTTQLLFILLFVFLLFGPFHYDSIYKIQEVVLVPVVLILLVPHYYSSIEQ